MLRVPVPMMLSVFSYTFALWFLESVLRRNVVSPQ